MSHPGARAAAALCGVLMTTGAWAVPAPATAPDTGGDKFPMTGGSLTIRAVQGTPGGPPIGAAGVEVRLYHRGALVDTIETRLDEHGVVVLEDLPLAMQVQPVARVAYKDLTYQQAGAVLDAADPQVLEVVCYEPTEEAPPWTVRMWHVVLERSPEGLAVREVLVVDNPADRTWIGVPGPNGRRVTTSFGLHGEAADASLGRGFHGWCCTTLSEGRLINHLALMPQTTEFSFRYVVPPADDGAIVLDVTAPAPVDHLMVLVPAEIPVEYAAGLEFTGTQRLGSGTLQGYAASGLHRGQVASVSLAGLVGTEAASAGRTGGLARIVAAAGGGLLLVLAVVVIFLRTSRPAAEAWPR
jgi:hypothetical protein